jgi:hypothetical protein
MAETTDTERLDWLTKSFDKGLIHVDHDLVGSPVIVWSAWSEVALGGFTDPRDAIDAAMRTYHKQEAAMAALNDGDNHERAKE